MDFLGNLFGGGDTNDLSALLKKHEIEEVQEMLLRLGVKNARDCAELEEGDIQNMDVPLVTKKKLYKIMTEAKTLRAVNAGAPIPTFGPGAFTQTTPVAPAGMPDPTQQPITTEWGGGRPPQQLQHQGSFGMNQQGMPPQLRHQNSLGAQGQNMNQQHQQHQHQQHQHQQYQPSPGQAPVQAMAAAPPLAQEEALPEVDKEAANKPDEDGLTPLMHAAKTGDKEAVEDLIAMGANVDAQNETDGKTPLHIAVEAGHDEVCEVLLEKKADPNLATKKGWTALFYAQDKRRPAIIKLLAKNSVNPDHQTAQGWTALMSAAFQGRNEEVVEILKSKADTNLKHTNGMSALSLAASQGFHECAEFLIMKKAEVNYKAPQGSPLMLAAQEGHMDVINILLKEGADAKDKDGNGQNAFQIAKANNKAEAAAVLKKPAGGGGCCAVA